MRRSPRTSIAGTDRSTPTRSGAGSSASSRGSIAWPPGSTSSSARSRPARAISRASSRRARRCWASRRLTVEEGLAAERRRSLRAGGRRARRSRSWWIPSAPRSAPGTSSSRARGAASPASRSCCRSSRKLGFDVLYLPPVHPIGLTHRKGRNNAPTARRSDPGSPWAIGERGRRAHGAAPRARQRGGLRAPDRARAASSASRSRSTSRSSARPTIPGCASTPTGSTAGPTARSSTPRTRPSATRTSTTSTSTPRTGARSGPRCATSCCTGSAQGVKVFRVDNPHTKPIAVLGVADRGGAGARTPRRCSWPRRSRGRR